MAHILVLGGGAAGLAAALAAAQTNPSARVTVLERNPRIGKKLLATGNGRCNLDHEGLTPADYVSAAPDVLRTLRPVPTRWAGSTRWVCAPTPTKPGASTPTAIRRRMC